MNGFALEILKQNTDRMNCVALIDRRGSRKITWESLKDNICRVAAYAKKKDLQGTVPVQMDKGMECTATVLGLNLAGIGVAPVSITTPASRCESISRQVGNDLWTIETFKNASKCAPAYEYCTEGREACPAYVVFTSGSTGAPKGVMLTNHAMMDCVHRIVSPDGFDLGKDDRVIQRASFSFIGINVELLAPLYAGSTVYAFPEKDGSDLNMLTDFINRFGITCAFMPPQQYRKFEGAPSLKCVILGGDKTTNINPKRHRVIGLYGMTETAGPCFHYEIRAAEEKAFIGIPYPDIKAYVLDENGNEAIEGELCMCGGIAYGYLGADELTQKTFTPNPFLSDSDNAYTDGSAYELHPEYGLLLHSGDIVRSLPEGGYQYLNRKDNMIKINGQRVEPGEIENVLMNYPGIDMAVAKGFPNEINGDVICAYYTANRQVNEREIVEYLEKKLPHYMIPSMMVKMDKIPVNSNGKVDRKALEMPDARRFLEKYEAPIDGKEETICRAFEKVLGLERVGRNDNFFVLGGDSISVLSLVNECRELEISTGDVFAGRTPREIAALAGEAKRDVYDNLTHEVNKTPLTDSQLGILLECGLEEKYTKYSIPVKMSFEKTEGLTSIAVKAAVDKVIKNHPALYAKIIEENGQFFMVRQAFPEEGICTVAQGDGIAAETISMLEKEMTAPMSIGNDPLCKAAVCEDNDKVHVLMYMHHVISDGTSLTILHDELKTVLMGGDIRPETVDAFELYESEQKIKAMKEWKQAYTYFANLLNDDVSDVNLIPDHKALEGAFHSCGREIFTIPREKIDKFLVGKDITENTFFMGVFGYVLAKMTGQSVTRLAAAENGRKRDHIIDTVSMMVKTIPVVILSMEERTGEELLTRIQTQFFTSMRNDIVGFNYLARDFGINSDVMFVYQSDMLNDMELLPLDETISNLNLMVFKQDDEYRFKLEYRSDMYEKYTIARFEELYKRATDAFISGAPIKDMELLSPADRAFLDDANISNCHPLGEENILDLFKKTVERLPQKTAIISDGRSYTYGEVDEISDRIGRYLMAKGIGRGSVVAVLIPRCEYMLIASLGIMKAGAAYQPLDPSYPEERLQFMIKDAGVKIIIKDRGLDHILQNFEGEVLYTDLIADLPFSETELPKIDLEDVYILLYTSGTTGTPKGVMLSHGNLRAFVQAHIRARELGENSIVAQYASYGFDAHMADIYPAIVMGCTITIIPDEIRLELAEIKDFCEKSGVTHLFMTTQVARQFAMAYPNVKGLEVVDTGGEKLLPFNGGNTYKFFNLYGPTEGTVCSTKFVVDGHYDNIPIGKATYNYRLYVVDSYGRRVPIGVPGELIQCGPQVGKGYLGREDLTAKSFVPNTFENMTELSSDYSRCYKTGDIVRFINDGNIEYIGRRDQQVKIRGFRIELGEVEKAILDYPPVKAATVTVLENESGKSLCAYVVSDENIDRSALGQFIAQSHPAYMVPAIIMQIDSIPLNINGKVDKKKLPEPKLQLEDIKKPENDLQQAIFDSVSEAIGTKEFGIDADIFMAGLSSIGSIQLCTLLGDKFGIPFKLRDLKKCQNVLGLEKFVRSEAPAYAEESEAVPSTTTEESKSLPVTETSAADVRYGSTCPITKTMEGIFTECLQHPGSTFYNIPYLIKLGDGIDEDRLKEAIAAAVEAHQSMKTELFSDEQGHLCQHLKLNDAYTAGDIRTIEVSGPEDINDSLVTSFELMGHRLFEISILKGLDRYLFINIHHIICDGTSMMLFLDDIEKAYRGEKLQAEEYSCFDVALEEEKSRTEEELREQKAYYDDLLVDTDKDFLLLSDVADEVEQVSETQEATTSDIEETALTEASSHETSVGTVRLEQEEADAKAIKDFCAKNKIGMNAYFVSVFGTVLAKYAGTDYSVFNTIYNGRNDSRTKNTVAMLVKTLPVVCRIDKEKTLDLLSDISGQLMDTMSNDLYSYAEISREFGLSADVMFIFQGNGFEREDFCGEKIEEIQLGLEEVKAAMSLEVRIKDGKLFYELQYDSGKFTHDLIKAFLQAFDMAAASLMKEEKLSGVTLLSPKNEEEMESHNATEKPYDRSRTIADMFEENLRLSPDALCVEYKGKKFTYKKIGDLTAKLSYFLMNQGVGRGDIVAILINRDENMVIGAYGAIRSGAAYLGLDPTYPSERLDFMVRDSKAKYLIADRSLRGLLREYDGDVIYTDEIESLELPDEKEWSALAMNEIHRPSPEDKALIVYSSGTTGLPKGSILRHRNIVCFYHNYTGEFNIGPASHVATYASFGFDGGAMDVFCVPMSGGALHVIPDEIRLDLSKLEQFYTQNAITNGFMTTQVGCMFISATKCRSLKYFTVGGEKFIPVTGPDWVTFKNGYGPSETMCYVNNYKVKNSGKLQPIGKVIGNTKEYIIDKYGNRLPYGACGELCIAGLQVGAGYLNRPEKTIESFVTNPFTSNPDYSIMYRTGDVVRMLPDGNYDFVGRRDGQVKIRGFRIELGEIEQQIRKYPGVTGTVVTAYDNPSGGKYLVAYVVMNEKLDIEKLKAFIGNEKPEYMIPPVIMQIEDIPLTSNGKVDLRKLPKPQMGSLKKGAEPENETEEKLCSIFGEVVGIQKVYADDDFFKIGGSSISAIQAVVKCEHAGFPVVYKNLFANPTPRKLAEFINKGDSESITATDTDKNKEYNYSALSYNVVENLKNIRNDGVGDVFLTGATGYLGSHIFKELIDSTPGRVICLIRSKEGQSAAIRLEAMMTYYFEDWYSEEMKSRVEVVDGDLEDENIWEKLKGIHFDTIINCAANVKHFAVEKELMGANFSGVENLIKLAQLSKAKLIHMSSLSISGEFAAGSTPRGYIFKESDLNIGQSLENRYIYTKFLGEQALIDAVSRKLIRGKIIRLGNLMARIDDSQFQVNAGQNGMLRMYLGFVKLGSFPVNMLDSELEFSPIDRVAKAVVLLAGTPDEFTVFHAKNCNSIHYSYLLQAIVNAGYPIDVVEDEVYKDRLQQMLKKGDDVTELGGLLAYSNNVDNTITGDKITNPVSTTFTTKALYRLGFGWPLISMEYLNKMVEMLVEFDFFDL